MSVQFSINFDAPSLPVAKAMGEIGMQLAAAHAEVNEPGFSARAKAFVIEYLRANGVSSGELITDAAKLAGIKPPDDRAFGSVYAALVRHKQIEFAGFCVRRKGHGTAGGRLWRLTTEVTASTTGGISQ